jgi:APA family basic amino acid/polyamine antiporter
MMISFIIAGFVCAVAALCYSELASMVPVSGSAYTYSYAVVGELLAWMVGWALILEYAVAASAVSVGWSGYFMGLLKSLTGFELPPQFQAGPTWSLHGIVPVADFSTGLINVPAIVVACSSRPCWCAAPRKAPRSMPCSSPSRWLRSACSSS